MEPVDDESAALLAEWDQQWAPIAADWESVTAAVAALLPLPPRHEAVGAVDGGPPALDAVRRSYRSLGPVSRPPAVFAAYTRAYLACDDLRFALVAGVDEAMSAVAYMHVRLLAAVKLATLVDFAPLTAAFRGTSKSGCDDDDDEEAVPSAVSLEWVLASIAVLRHRFALYTIGLLSRFAHLERDAFGAGYCASVVDDAVAEAVRATGVATALHDLIAAGVATEDGPDVAILPAMAGALGWHRRTCGVQAVSAFCEALVHRAGALIDTVVADAVAGDAAAGVRRLHALKSMLFDRVHTLLGASFPALERELTEQLSDRLVPEDVTGRVLPALWSKAHGCVAAGDGKDAALAAIPQLVALAASSPTVHRRLASALAELVTTMLSEVTPSPCLEQTPQETLLSSPVPGLLDRVHRAQHALGVELANPAADSRSKAADRHVDPTAPAGMGDPSASAVSAASAAPDDVPALLSASLTKALSAHESEWSAHLAHYVVSAWEDPSYSDTVPEAGLLCAHVASTDRVIHELTAIVARRVLFKPLRDSEHATTGQDFAALADSLLVHLDPAVLAPFVSLLHEMGRSTHIAHTDESEQSPAACECQEKSRTPKDTSDDEEKESQFPVAPSYDASVHCLAASLWAPHAWPGSAAPTIQGLVGAIDTAFDTVEGGVAFSPLLQWAAGLYARRFPNRTLQWPVTAGVVHVTRLRGSTGPSSPTNESHREAHHIHCPPCAAHILLLFNARSEVRHSEIARAFRTAEASLAVDAVMSALVTARVLHRSVVPSGSPTSSDEPKGRDALYTVNDAAPRKRVDITLPASLDRPAAKGSASPPPASQAEQQAVDVSRQRIVEAAIVREMKRARVMQHQALFAAATEQVRRQFPLSVPLFKRALTLLLDREYLARSAHEQDSYRYLV